MVFKMLTDTNTLITQLKSGEVNMVVQVPYNQLSQVQNVEGIELMKGPLLSFQHMDFNFRVPTLADINVRKAIAHALDRVSWSRRSKAIRSR